MNRRWQTSAVFAGLFGPVVALQIHAGRTFREYSLSRDAPILYVASALASFCVLGYLGSRRSDLNRLVFYVFAVLGLVLSVLGVHRSLHIVVVEWGSV